MSETTVRNLTLHEAMIHALLERKLSSGVVQMTNADMALAIKARDSFRQENGDHADAAQIFLRARQCPEWFHYEGNAQACTITLRAMKCGGA